MSTVFIGGSRAISQLNAEVQAWLDMIMYKELAVLVGDAVGADKAAQAYLHTNKYPHVEVFCTEGVCRNNIGNWKMRKIPADTPERNAQFYYAKDRVMAQEATSGFMIWDEKSVGTLLNVSRLLNLQKKSVVYIVPQHRFLEFKSPPEWEPFISRCNTTLQQKVRLMISREPSEQSGPASRASRECFDSCRRRGA
ncbi:MAG TPA: hypothetical protein VGZ00_03595 [Candidatus Baltobacteraceae bacterium]|jgi:adenine-specific DNA-methyltransferase|nr:hypothetical protein [Candidatus Baltobacteraceae bacterium]